MAKKIKLSHSGLAKVASGVPISQVEHEEVEEVEASEGVEAQASESSGVETALESSETTEQASVETPVVENVTETVPEMVAFLKGELSTVRAELAALQVSKLQQDARLTDAEANSEGLLKAALHGAGLLQVMLGQAPVSLEGLPASTVSAQYGKYRQQYEARYVVGQQSLDSNEASTEEPVGVAAALKVGLRPVG